MAFYDGTVNSFDDLRTALVDACTAEGWNWADGILSKGAHIFAPTLRARSPRQRGQGCSSKVELVNQAVHSQGPLM